MLIGTNTDMIYKEVKYGLCNVSVGDYQPIYDREDVFKYCIQAYRKECGLRHCIQRDKLKTY